ncbi:unnamed protein product [Rotaria socialis]|uniref:Protein kinase domain-containing protein n=1 Tax=Rotaria socialis TaxID=392032 RepID=A0A821GZ30_9BILA|nr:unnamed protein product [Rotaria socialis]CAF3386247.1 unnamed protein product [Rotaria socialis]CAF3387396.1 unnamed protein product [Rotaria socialis]CAF3637885.1 unnamed protein product [Rotaria socialis]CAF3783357.1 unnamed protein product [Rotaria socialis]
MGTKISKDEHDHNSSQNTNPYENIHRAYAKLNHSSGLVTHNASCFTNYEIRNLNKYKQISQKYLDQKKIIQSSLIKASSPIEKPQTRHLTKENSRYNNTTHGVKLKSERSHSVVQPTHSNNLITAEQIVKCHSQRRRQYKPFLSQSSDDIFQDENNQNSLSTIKTNQFISSKNKNQQIPADLKLVLIKQHDLQNAHEIGKGNFGTVYHALYKGTRDVALKTLQCQRRHCSNRTKALIEENDVNMYELFHEAHIMTHLKHINLLCILGVSSFGKEKQLSLVTDFMKNGSLLNYLKQRRDIFNKLDSKDVILKLNSFSKQIFQAMLFLEERSIIHRDLAARNCLIDQDDTLKVADFGLTKLTECGLYKGTSHTICAIRWTSPEAIFLSQYTSRSDVWSYGITLWEIYSLGELPFGNTNNIRLKTLLKNQSENLTQYLPQSTKYGFEKTYTDIILPCLSYNVNLKPNFHDLIERVQMILHDK